MINRVLIRIKVVQMLYSHLLIESHFMLEPQPSAPTKEKRFAHKLYMDMLMFMCRIAEGVSKRGGQKPLADTRFMRRLRDDDQIKNMMMRYGVERFAFDGCVLSVVDKLKESTLYKNFIKKHDGTGNADVALWRDILERYILADPDVKQVIQSMDGYTAGGVERSRQILEKTFVNFMRSQDNIHEAREQLEKSLDKARDLYMRLLWLPVELADLRMRQIEEGYEKLMPSFEDRNPNMRFVESDLVSDLRNNPVLTKYVEREHINMLANERPLLERLLRTVMSSEIYKEFMSFPATDRQTDYNFWRDLYRKVLLADPDFLESMEEKSVFWNDDLDVEGDFVLKTFRRFAIDAVEHKDSSDFEPVLPQYKDREDAEFGALLFTDVVRNKETYREMIDAVVNTDVWDRERLAFMDVVILMAAIGEIINFPKIPLSVSVNEYIEIAKCYSTPKSGQFVNGLLASIIRKLQDEGRITKTK